MAQPLYTVQTSSEAWPNAGSQAERALNKGYMPDAFITAAGGETANISPATVSTFTSTGDQTAIYKAGRRLRIVHGGASTDTTYCEVATAVLTGGSTATTVTIRNITAGATDLSVAAISEVGISPVWASSSGGNIPMSTGGPTTPTWSFQPYRATMGIYASSSSIIGFSAAGATAVTIGDAYVAVGSSPANAGQVRLGNNATVRWFNQLNTASLSVRVSSNNDFEILDSDGVARLQYGFDISAAPGVGATILSLSSGSPALRIGSSAATAGLIRLQYSTAAIVGRTSASANDTIWPGQYFSTSLAADVSCTAAGGTGTTVLSKSLAAGTWEINAHISVNSTGVGTYAVAHINDGTNRFASGYNQGIGGSTTTGYTFSLHTIVSHTSALTYALSLIGGTTLMKALADVPIGGSTGATILNAKKIG